MNNCFSCRQRQAPCLQKKIANFPEDGLTPSKPAFTDTGVDCFGPFTVRRGQTAKRYGVLFTCLAIHAVHIVIAHSMDTESFINTLSSQGGDAQKKSYQTMAVILQEARRDYGSPSKSPLSTLFVVSSEGGDAQKKSDQTMEELRESIQEWNYAQIHEFLLQNKIKWVFNPPFASYHRGLWERCIRTVRKVMNALMREQVLDDEGLSTLICEVESTVNGRPISKVADNPRDLNALMLNHLLLLQENTAPPSAIFLWDDNYTCRKWRQVQYLSNVFWSCWTKEYLPSLQQRQKWLKPQCNLAVNDFIREISTQHVTARKSARSAH